ncbi:MAG: aquaporin family protein [Nevskia sp.]|nr:aquaporin family protein [Nevskia sp.]
MNTSRRYAAEFIGTALLLAVVVGSGIMGEQLAGGNVAIALLANSLATGGGLVALILVFGPVSGAHFNPAVSLALAASRRHAWADVPGYLIAQVAGGIAGVWAAHAMFGAPILQVSEKLRPGAALMFSEVVATFGLLTTIFGCIRNREAAVPYAVALYIVAAYWFTASTSFANPAVTVARSLTNTFAGIRPLDVPGFIAAQLVGAALATALDFWLHGKRAATTVTPAPGGEHADTAV